MNVHIVCRQTGDHVLTRLASALARCTDWTFGWKPNRRADVNYFLPYLFHERVSTASAAYFTHLEQADANKAAIWRQVDAAVNLRTTSAAMFLSELRHVHAIVRPPVDRDKFSPGASRRMHDRPVVGIVGMTYRTGRKGEYLVAMLAQSALAREIRLIASGRGWPVTTKRYDWHDFESFYRNLDVLLCPSILEGVPMPPLEALSCGVPVVIPRGVGLLDTLPDAPGIERYRAGNFDEMALALRRVIQQQRRLDVSARYAQAERLRSYTEIYTDETWAADHVAAFEGVAVG